MRSTMLSITIGLPGNNVTTDVEGKVGGFLVKL
jgi:hypothetical protein